jgi:hypothetical protein
VKERQILFSAPMVRAILDGSKTQTRRILKVPDGIDFAGGSGEDQNDPANWGGEDADGMWWALADAPDVDRVLPCRYGQPGDRLWVKETWRTYRAFDPLPPRTLAPGAGVQYEAGGSNVPGKGGVFDTIHGMGKLRPSIFMPRWASRITLEVTGVRVERLQECSEADAEAEGVDRIKAKVPMRVDAYRYLWDDINGPGSWDANPWVWVVEFKRTTQQASEP